MSSAPAASAPAHPSDPRERVAVIVVHGVGDQQPMASALTVPIPIVNVFMLAVAAVANQP